MLLKVLLQYKGMYMIQKTFLKIKKLVFSLKYNL